jgi:branched-chain amino acid transport system substrate-binding protein
MKRARELAVPVVFLLVITGFVWLSLRTEIQPQSDQTTTLNIVGLLPLTGPAASGGEYIRNGIELGRQEVEQRYPDQLQVQVKLLDSKNQPREAISVLQAELVQQRPDVIISGLSSVSQAIIPTVEQEGILTIVTTTALSGITDRTRTLVRVYPTSENFVEPLANYMATKFDRVAILYINDVFGQENQKIFAQRIKATGKQITATETFELIQRDSRAIISKVLATSPQAVFVTGYGPAFIAVFRQIRESNPNLPLFSEIGFANPAVLEALGEGANGIIFDGTEMELSNPSSAAVAAFQAKYRSQFNVEPYQVVGFAYDTMLLLAKASMKSGTFKKPNKETILFLSPFQGIMGQINFDAEGDSQLPLMLMKRVDGQTVLLSEQSK